MEASTSAMAVAMPPAVALPVGDAAQPPAAAEGGALAGAAEGDEEPAGPTPVETLYVNNLNEKIQPKVMKVTLKNLFRQYGVVLDVVAHKNIRMRGQAFVAMTDRTAAERAVKEIRGFPLYGKPVMVQFARTPSDAVVKRKTPALLDVHLEERKARKSRLALRTRFYSHWLISSCSSAELSRRANPLRKKAAAAKGLAKQGKLALCVQFQRSKLILDLRTQLHLEHQEELLPQNAILSKCQTSIFLPTRFSSSKICQTVQANPSSRCCSRSIRTCTISVLFQEGKALLSSSLQMRAALQSRGKLYITTRSMKITR
jgi:hypothetical protein